MAEEDKKDKEETPSSSDIRVKVVEEDAPEESSGEEKKEDSKEKIENESEETTSEQHLETAPSQKSRDSIPFWVLLISFLLGLTLGGGLVGGIFYFRSNVDNLGEELLSNTATPAPTTGAIMEAEEETSAEEEINLADYALQVLNGTGSAGEAGSAADLLTESGFENVDTGNSSTLGFEETVVQAKEGVPQKVLDTIEASLVQYVVEFAEEALDDSSDFDVVITVGSSRS